MTYAENTSVSTDKSRNEIERTLVRYGAKSFMYGWQGTQVIVAFEMNGKQIRFELKMPNRDEYKLTETGRKRTEKSAEAAYERASRQKWRALALVIKAKLEAVSSGISMFEEEFLSNIVLGNNMTVGQFMLPQVETYYLTGEHPKLLGGGNN